VRAFVIVAMDEGSVEAHLLMQHVGGRVSRGVGLEVRSTKTLEA